MKNYTTRVCSLLSQFVVIAFLFASTVSAQGVELSEHQQQQIDAQIEAFKSQMQLSEDQVEAVEPILQHSFTERLAILNSYGINPNDPDFKRPKMGTMRKMKKKMDQLEKDTKKALADHLSKDQLATWEELETERRNRMRERMQNGN